MKVLTIVFVVFLSSCAALHSPTKKREAYGNLVSCVEDSTGIFSAENIFIRLKANREINKHCSSVNLSAYEDGPWWPAWIHFDFKKQVFFFLTNGRIKAKETKVSWEDYDGYFEYNKRKNLITLIVPEFKWQKSFIVAFDDQTLQLTAIDTIINVRERARSKKRDDEIINILNKYTE